MSIRIGLLGCGSIARSAHLPSLARIPGATVTAIADGNPANLSAAASLAPSARQVDDYAAVLEMPDVDAVVIALPPALHADAALAAIERRKHLYVEKPLATSLADAERVATAWAGSALTGMMGFNYRFNPVVQRARARLTARAVGDVVAVRTVFSTSRRAIPPWKQRRETGGGVLLDLAVHHIDLVRFLLGADVARVNAEIDSAASGEDTAFLQLRLTNGVTVQSMCSLSAVDEDRFEVFGSTGKLTIDRYRSLRVEETPAVTGGALGTAASRLAGELGAAPYALEKMRSPMHDPSFPAAMTAFVNAIEHRLPGSPSLADGLTTIAVIDAAERSAKSGGAIDLEPALAAPPTRAEKTSDSTIVHTAADAPTPELSVVLITPDSFETLRRTVGHLVRQTAREKIELVIVAPAGASIDVDSALVAPLASVRIVRLASLSPSGPARAAAVRAARAPIVAFGEEHCFPAPTWAQALIDAHRGDFAAVGPAMRNANPETVISWADLVMGYGPWMAPVEKHEPEFLPGHNSSYKRAALLEYDDRLDTLMESETVLMWDLRAKGRRLLLDPAAETSHMNFGYWSSWLPVMFLNGRAFADTRSRDWGLVRRLVFVAASPAIPLVRLSRALGHVRRLGRSPAFLAKVIPTLAVGLVADGVGQMTGYALGAGNAHARLAEFEWHRRKHAPASTTARS
jgi:predicted dehydrogenase